MGDAMKQLHEDLLDRAVQAIHGTEPDAAELSASARRVAERLNAAAFEPAPAHEIEGCDDVRRLLPAYRTGTLGEGRTLLVAAHLRECGSCLMESRAGVGATALDWRSPVSARVPRTRVPLWKQSFVRWGAAPALASLMLGTAVYSMYFRVLPGVHAEVQSVEGATYRISGGEIQQIAAGATLAEGDRVRTGSGAHAVLRLTDGSAIEMNERSVVGVGERGRDTNILLENGDVVVQAAHREDGHLYVRTADFRVAVTGTIFAVDAGIKGSSVAVLQGAVQVNQSGNDRVVKAGDQMATYQTAGYTPVAQQIAWSHDRARYLPLLAQFAVLEHRLQTVAFPASRYTSDLVSRMPADTTFYLSIPNLGEQLSQANRLFQDQLQHSPELQQWFDGKRKNNTDQLNATVAKLHDMSGYLGDELVVVGRTDSTGANFAVVADVRRSGLADYLRTQFAPGPTGPGLTVLDEQSLATAVVSPKGRRGGYALVRDREVVFSGDIATLRAMDHQLSAGTSGFAAQDFGREIMAAYQRGAGIILAADLQKIRAGKPAPATPAAAAPRFLLVEHRELNGQPENHLSVQFAGTRQGVASWLAAPAPIGSLNFVSPNAAIAVALLSKDPKAIADDLLTLMKPGSDQADLNSQGIAVNLRNDVAANLGGDFLVALDGPVLPTPAWKIVAEVNNADGLEQAFERFATASQRGNAAGHGFKIASGEASGRKFYSLQNLDSGLTVAEYTFAEGYLLVAPDRALLLEALHTRATGVSLARSAAFKAQLPKDENENYSAVAYQNLSPVLAPLLAQLSGPEADTLRELAVDAKPTTICAWGKGDRIEAGSNSRLLGSEFLTLAALLHPGKKHGTATPSASVPE